MHYVPKTPPYPFYSNSMYSYPMNFYPALPYPYYHSTNTPMHHPENVAKFYQRYFPTPLNVQLQALNSEGVATRIDSMNTIVLKDYGPTPFVVNIEKATKKNNTYRTALWTGKKFQVTVMSINVGEDIGLEIHPSTDQFIRIEEGQGLVQMGDSKDKLDFEKKVYEDDAIMVPVGKWHNLINTGNKPLKVYVIYAPPEHPFGTIHETKAIAMAAD